jgi:hypothetical protein
MARVLRFELPALNMLNRIGKKCWQDPRPAAASNAACPMAPLASGVITAISTTVPPIGATAAFSARRNARSPIPKCSLAHFRKREAEGSLPDRPAPDPFAFIPGK